MPCQRFAQIIVSDFDTWILGNVTRISSSRFRESRFESAVERWNKGRERFNYSKYVAFMIIRSDEAAYMFDALPIEHKLGFYWKELNLKSVVCIPEWNNPESRSRYGYSFSAIVNSIAEGRAGKNRCRNINWMNFLQFKDGFIRKI